MDHGSLWLDQPVMLHSSREYMCKFNTTEQCDFQTGYWRFWYEADHRYAIPTIGFFLTAIGLFAFGHLLAQTVPKSAQHRPLWRKGLAAVRYLTYQGYRLGSWNSAPLGMLLLGGVGAIYFFSMTLATKPYYWPNTATVSYGDSPSIATRSGWLSIACMPFLLATSSKANMVTLVTGISHERLQVVHRWTAYAFLVTALIHTFPFVVYHIQQGDMVMVVETQVYYWTGIAALIAQGWLTFASWSPLSHFVMAAIFMVTFFWHCNGTLTSWDYFIASAAIYVPCFVYSTIKTYFQNGLCRADLSLTPNGFIRVAVAVDFDWQLGQHCFVRFADPSVFGIHALTAHPFTICSLPKGPGEGPSELVFFIRIRGGFTKRLHHALLNNPQRAVSVRALVEGPYGGVGARQFAQADRVVVVAGGSGAGWTLGLVAKYARRVAAEVHGVAKIDTVAAAQSEAQAAETQSEASSLLPAADEKHAAATVKAPSHSSAESQSASSSLPSSLRVILATRDVATVAWYKRAVADAIADALRGHSLSAHVLRSRIAVEVHETYDPARDAQQLREKVEADLEHAAAKDLSGSDSADSASDGPDPAETLPFHWLERRGRPDLAAAVAQEAAASTSASSPSVGVFVCGPEGMQQDVRAAAARAQLGVVRGGAAGLYLHMEHFSWA